MNGLSWNVMGSIEYQQPRTFTYHYAAGRPVIITGVLRFTPVFTGCHVLQCVGGKTVSVPPGYRYVVIQEGE